MIVKKFTGLTMQDVMAKVRSELGNEAVILNSKMVQTGGFLGLFKKKNVEVIAAIDPEVEVTNKKAQTKIKTQAKQPIKEEILKKEKPRQQETKEMAAILEELQEVKKLLHTKKTTIHSPTYEHLPDILRELYSRLKNLELQEELMDELMEKAWESWQNDKESKLVIDHYMDLIKTILTRRVDGIIGQALQADKKYINIVGPTGVGKTTTVAKMAAEYVIKRKKKIAFITTDTYRIGAIDQLKTYAQILGVPVEVAYNAGDFQQAVERFSHYEHIFIDTAGRNFRNSQYVADLKEIIDFNADMKTLLVLSVTSKEKDMDEIYHQFSHLPLDGFIFTKTDETSQAGAVINFIDKYKIPVVYLTNGQNVPDDMIEGTAENIISVVLGGDEHA